MKRQIIGITIAISPVLLTVFPGSTSIKKQAPLPKNHLREYQAIKIENSLESMLNPDKGGIRPMPPPPPWIPPVEETNNEMLRNRPKPGYETYTPIRHLPQSAPLIIPVEKDSQFPYNNDFPIR